MATDIAATSLPSNRFAGDPFAGRPAVESTGPGLNLWGDDGFGFDDLLDIVNPLQHLPVISTVYRALTGDEIAAAPRLIGGGLFGGAIGAVASAVNLAVEADTGRDVGGHLLALLNGEETFGPGDGDGPVMIAQGFRGDPVWDREPAASGGVPVASGGALAAAAGPTSDGARFPQAGFRGDPSERLASLTVPTAGAELASLSSPGRGSPSGSGAAPEPAAAVGAALPARKAGAPRTVLPVPRPAAELAPTLGLSAGDPSGERSIPLLMMQALDKYETLARDRPGGGLLDDRL